MTIERLEEVFGNSEEYRKFDRLATKRSQRPDLHAFLLLDELCPDTSYIVACAEHDEICLDIDTAQLAEVATEDQILELVRCGVRYNDGSLEMFV